MFIILVNKIDKTFKLRLILYLYLIIHMISIPYVPSRDSVVLNLDLASSHWLFHVMAISAWQSRSNPISQDYTPVSTTDTPRNLLFKSRRLPLGSGIPEPPTDHPSTLIATCFCYRKSSVFLPGSLGLWRRHTWLNLALCFFKAQIRALLMTVVTLTFWRSPCW